MEELRAMTAANVALWSAAQGTSVEDASVEAVARERSSAEQVRASLRRSAARLDAGDRESARLRAELAALRVAPGMLPATALVGVATACAGSSASFALDRSIAALERDVAKQRAALARILARRALSFRLRLLLRALERLQCRSWCDQPLEISCP